MSEGLDYFGVDDEVGLDYSTLLQGAGGLAQGVMTQVQADQAKDKVSADEAKKLAASIAADVTAVSAAAKTDTTAPKVGRVTGATAVADAQAAKIAMAAADKAAAALSPESQQKRADAADKALADAVAREQKDPKNEFLAAMVTEWTSQANKAHSGSISSGDNSDDSSGGGKKGKHGKDKSGSGGNWFTRPVLGPIPGGGVLAIGAGVLGGIGFILKKFVFKKVGI